MTLSSFLNIDTVRADLTLNIAGYGTLTINSIDISIDPWLSSITLDSGGRFFVTQEGITFSGINETATTLKGTWGVDKWTGRGNTNETYYGRGGDDDLDGGPSNDVLNGGAGNDVLSGSEGSDTLLGTYGDDELHGGPGNDILNGSAGDDTADYSTAAAGIVTDLSTGEALADGDGGTDTLIGIEYVTGSPFDDTIRGDSRANHLTATGGDNSFFGGAGDDIYTYMTGNLIIDEEGSGSKNDVLEFAPGIVEANLTFIPGPNDLVIIVQDPEIPSENLGEITIVNQISDVNSQIETIRYLPAEDAS